MAVSDLILEGVNLMLIGMGIVFVFLATLVVAMYGMSLLAQRLAPDTSVAELPASHPTPTGGVRDGELIAVITAAVSRYRSGGS